MYSDLAHIQASQSDQGSLCRDGSLSQEETVLNLLNLYKITHPFKYMYLFNMT